MATGKKSNTRQRAARNLVILGVILILVNILAYNFHIQADLTTDKRYSTTRATEHLVSNLEQPVHITVFLTGRNVPAAFQRLAKSTQDVLLNFKKISKHKIDVVTVDPNGDDTTVLRTLRDFGMEGVIAAVDAGKQGTQQKMIFPWVLVENVQTGAAIPVFIQETNAPQLSRTVLNKSEMLLEYNIANAISQVTKKERETVVFLTGNGEDLGYNYMSAIGHLANYYLIDTLNLKMAGHIPPEINTLIISSPYEAFSEVEKYKLDQYLMRGGNIFMLLNQATGSLDSFRQGNGKYNVLPVDLNLSDLLFDYGVRINPNVLADGAEYEMIPLSKSGRKEESMLYPWIYFPVLSGNADHPVTKNLDGVLGRFVSSIDVLDQNDEIEKTVLLSTSRYTKKLSLPLSLSLFDAVIEFNIAEFNASHIPVAVLLEGNFRSHYADRQPAEVQAYIQQSGQQPLTGSGGKGKLIVVSDGDVIYNDIVSQGPLDLGQYIYGGYRYDNKSFLLNAVEYLSNEHHLLEARNKSFSNRILDPQRVKQERARWQLVNIGVPVIMILLLGGIWGFVRKKRYA